MKNTLAAALALIFGLCASQACLGQTAPEQPAPGQPGAADTAMDAETAAFLKAYDATRHNPVAAGLKSFSCEILMNLPDKRLPEGKIKVAYAWNAPYEEVVSTEEGGPLKKLFNENFTQIWKGITGDLVSEYLSAGSAKHLKEPDGVRIEVLRDKKTVANLFFDENEKRLVKVESLKGPRTVRTYAYEKQNGKLVVSTETIETDKSAEQGRSILKFARHREVNGFTLPTLLTLARPKGEVMLDITFVTVNGKPAQVAGQDVKDLKAKISEFEKGWPKWDPLQKSEEVKKLAGEGGPHVAATLAKYINDPEPMVRIEIVRALASIKDVSSVPALIAALDTNRKDKEIDVFKEVCKALGLIGDARAVLPLSKNIMGGKRGDGTWHAQAQARIDALGSIKHVSAVDELISLFGLCGGAHGGYAHYRVMVSKSLRNLTGKEFRDQNDWRDWWSKNKATFKFE